MVKVDSGNRANISAKLERQKEGTVNAGWAFGAVRSNQDSRLIQKRYFRGNISMSRVFSILLLLVLVAGLVEAQSSSSAASYFSRAKLRLDHGDLDGAISDFDLALVFNPRLADAYCNRGVARYNKGDFAAAMKDFDSALEISPRSAFAYNNRANARLATREDRKST